MALGFSRSATATAADRLRNNTIGPGTFIRTGEQSWAATNQLLTARIHELRTKSQFIVLKSPDDRRANGVPDVAVMMWFPNPETERKEDVDAAKARYEIFKESVAEASNGLATLNKIDDPSIVPQDRISAAVEVWLEKAVVVICDLAGQRHNVYYEFGYARATGTEVLLTCPKSEASSTKLHLGHWQRVEYSNLEELKTGLIEKLKVLMPKYDLSGSV